MRKVRIKIKKPETDHGRVPKISIQNNSTNEIGRLSRVGKLIE